MSEPFTPARVTRFLILVMLGVLAVVLIVYWLFYARPHKSVEPSGPPAAALQPATPGQAR